MRKDVSKSSFTEKSSFPKMEENILSFWESEDILGKCLDKGVDDFVFYDGPPGTNGSPHIGHMLQSTLKDLWPRYKTMQGYKVVRKAGWDTHGLPIELAVEKELGLSSKKDIIEYGLSEFIKRCRETVFRYKKEWVFAIKRIGRMLDFDDEYITLTNDFIQSDWWVLKQAFDKGLLYKGYKVLAYCPRLGTSLSNHEVALGYKEVTDISVYAKFPLLNEENTYFIAWTTTLWTLIGNVALALGASLNYTKIKVKDEYYIIAEDRIAYFKEKGFIKDFSIIETIKGKDLALIPYKPLWNYFDHIPQQKHYALLDDFVTTDEGSGIVHLALYGEDDYRIIKKNNLPFIQHVNKEGKFIKECTDYEGRLFDEEDLPLAIIKDLAKKNLILAKEKITHNYPFNYRTGTRLMYYAKSSWFLKTTAYKEDMIKANKAINWYPEHIKEGRFGKWLSSNVDWAISRERFWGSPLPIWICKNCKKQLLISSIKELNAHAKETISDDFDLHIPNIDGITLSCPDCASPMKREPDVLDCWFNSGVVPWGQIAYPEKDGSSSLLNRLYPADFICEGIDQTRGWFYALLAISTMINKNSSYKSVICTELVLDKDGNKMSKSKGNVVDPLAMFDTYGADAMRWLFIKTNPGNPIRFSTESLKDSIKEIILPLWNIYSFFITYAKIDNYINKEEPKKLTNLLDIWIISENKTLILEVTKALDGYDPTSATAAISSFIDKLSNWYIRRSRRRFWKSLNDEDKIKGYDTLHFVLLNLIKVLAPFLPFITEEIYRNIAKKSSPISIHLCSYPKAREDEQNKEIEYKMNLIRDIVSLGRSLRNKYQLKIRQPLRALIIILSNTKDKKIITDMQEQVKEELNIKEIEFKDNDKELIDYSIKPNLRLLGKRFGKDLQKVIPLITAFSAKEIDILSADKTIAIKFNNEELSINPSEVIIEKQAKEGLLIEVLERVTVALDANLDNELIKEGIAREFVNKIQNMRKENNLDILDRITIDFYSKEEIVSESVNNFKDYIKNETLANSVNFLPKAKLLSSKNNKEWSLNNIKTNISISKNIRLA